MNRFEYLKGKIDEAISEIASDYETFDDYKKGAGKPGSHSCFAYSQVDKESIPNICANGAEGAKEFMNTDHMYYGSGIYTTLSFDACTRYHEGNAMVKYLVKSGAFDNFLIFDIGVRKLLYKIGVLTKHEKISATCRRLFTSEDFAMLERRYGTGLARLDDMVMRCDMNSNSWSIEEEFWSMFRGERNMQFRPGSSKYYNEKKLDESNVDGFAYYASSYGPVAIFRSTDLIVPYSYAYRNGNGWSGGWPDEKDFTYCMGNEEAFNNSNYVVDAFRRKRKDYPDTGFTEKTSCGFSLVKKGKKYNFLSARTHKLLSPLDFDFASAFDPFTNTTTCGVDTHSEEGVIEFMIKTDDYGKNLAIKYRQVLNDEKTGWFDISYSDFIGAMEGFKAEMGSLNESVDEVFTHKDFDTFQKSINDPKNVIIYRATDPRTAKIEFENGSNREFSGTSGDNSLYYGLGVYCVRDTVSLYCRKYGNGVVKFILKDGFKDFIIFDNDLRAKVDPGKSVYDEIVRLVPKDLFNQINNHLANNDRIFYAISGDLRNNGIEGFKNIKNLFDYHRNIGNIQNTAKYAKAFMMTLLGHRLGDPVAPAVRDEKLLSKTKIRGIVFTGADDGRVVVVRDFNSVMPIDYSVDGGKTWEVESGRARRTKDNFDRINTNVDPYYLYRNDYEDVSFRAHPSGNFSMVKGKSGYNWKDIWFHRSLLPVDADTATNFDPFSNTAQFAYGDYQFAIKVDDNLNCDLKFKDEGAWEDIPYDMLISAIGMMQEQGIISKDKQINNNCLLNPATNRNK